MSEESRLAAINPYESPAPLSSEQNEAERLHSALRGPAMALILLGGLSALYLLAFVAVPVRAVIAVVETIRAPGSEACWEAWKVTGQTLLFGVYGAINGVMFWGGLNMRRQDNYRRARAGAIAACIPTPMCWLTAPFGIWALILLRRPEMRAAFKSEQSTVTT